MACAILCGESSPSYITLFRSLNRTLDSIKDNIAVIFANILGCQAHTDDEHFRSEEGVVPSTFDELLEKYKHLGARDWLPNKRNAPGNDPDPQAEFNVLDTMLMDNLERLKTMRSVEKTVCNSKMNYIEQMEGLCVNGKLGPAFWLRRKLMTRGNVPNLWAHNCLLKALCKAGDMERANRLIREMLEVGLSPNCVTYNTLMNGYCLLDEVDKALYIFSSMVNSGVRPSSFTYSILVHALHKKGLLDDATKLLEDILADDDGTTYSGIVLSTTVMDGHFKTGNMVQALSLWVDMQRSTQLDVPAYNVVIHGFSLNHHMDFAYGYLCEMTKKGLPPDIYTCNSLISGLCKERKFEEACYIYDIMPRMGIIPDQTTYTIIIQAFCIEGDVVRAHKFLCNMLEKLIVPEPLVWNNIINCYGRCGDISNAVSVKDQMLAFSVQPNVYTYNAMIHAQVKGGSIVDVLSVEKEMFMSGLFPDAYTYNMLMWGACNSGQFAIELTIDC